MNNNFTQSPDSVLNPIRFFFMLFHLFPSLILYRARPKALMACLLPLHRWDSRVFRPGDDADKHFLRFAVSRRHIRNSPALAGDFRDSNTP